MYVCIIHVSSGLGLAYKYYLLQHEDELEVDKDNDEEGYVCMYVCILYKHNHGFYM